jgi:dTDP-4-amino-4,6-dideoxygalactose transaminase
MGWPQINDNMINEVGKVLKSGKLNQWNNDSVNKFETKFSDYIGCKYSVAVSNGTVALELCIKTLDLKNGDEIIVTPRTFIASALCCAINNVNPVFLDVDINSQNITLDNIKKTITKKTKAIILVHLAGWPCELDEICKFCKENNIFVIEDCAQSHGAKYNNISVGNWGDINAWSFCHDKIITTGGEGGMVTTNNNKLFKKAWSIKDHGKDYDSVFNKQHPFGFRWLHKNIGTNWRMMPIQAVIGIEALELLDKWVEHRRKIANIYNNNLKHTKGVRLTIPPKNVYHSYYKYYFFINKNEFKISRNEIIKEINKNSIIATVGSCGEIYKESSLNKFKPSTDLKNTKELFESGIMLLCDPTISIEKAKNEINIINNILNKNVKKHL